MPSIENLQQSLDELRQKKDDTKNKKVSEKYNVVVNGISDTLEQIFKSGGIITDEEYNKLDEEIKAKKLEFLRDDANALMRKIIFGTLGVAAVIGTLFWLSRKRKKI